MLIGGCVSAAEPWSDVTSSSVPWAGLAGGDSVPLVTDGASEVLRVMSVPLRPGPSPGFRARGDEKLHPPAVPLSRNARLQRNPFGIWCLGFHVGRCEAPGVSTSLTRSEIPSCWEPGIPC